MMPKPTFIKEVDDNNDDIDYEHAFCIRIVFAGDNQTHPSVMGRNIFRPLDEQRLSGMELSKQKQLTEWLHYRRYNELNVM